MNPFNWIRKAVADAVEAGFADGLERLHVGTADTAPALAGLRERLAEPAGLLPAAEVEEPAAAPAKTRKSR